MTVSLIGFSSWQGKKDPSKTWINLHVAVPKRNFVGTDVFSCIFDSSICPELLDIQDNDFPVDLEMSLGFDNKLESLSIL